MLAIIILIFELGLLAAMNGTGITDVGGVAATGLILVFTLGFAASVQNSDRLRKCSNALILGYLLRVFLLYFDLYANNIFVLPNSGADAEMFYAGALRYMESGGATRTVFPLVMGTIFRFIGQNRLYGQFLVMLCSVVSLVVLAYTMEDLDISDESRKRVFMIVCLLPNFAILSSIFLRESMVTMFVTISACLMVSWIVKGGNLKVPLAIAASIAASYFHSGTVGITIGCVLAVLIYDQKERRVRLSGGHILLAIVVALGASFVYLRYGNWLLSKFNAFDSLEDIANTSEKGGSSYARYVGNSNNPINMLIYSIPRMVYFLFSPFPWQWRGISDIIAFFFSGLYYIVVIKDIFVYLRGGQKRNRGMVFSLLLMAFFTTYIFAWGTSNTGTAARHRDKMVCLYGVLFALTRADNGVQTVSEQNETKPVGLRYIK